MALIYASQTAVITIDGVITKVTRGDRFDDDDPIVRERPDMFEEPVEEATANPGQRRNTQRR